MLKTIYDKFTKTERPVYCYPNKRLAQKDASLMNACSTMFEYKPLKGLYWWHVVSVDTRTNKPWALL